MRLALVILLLLVVYGSLAQDHRKIVRVPVIFHIFYSDNLADNGINPTAWNKGNSTSNLPAEKIIAELNDLHDDFLLLNKDTVSVDSAFKHLISNPRIEFILADTVLQSGNEKGIRRTKARVGKRRAVVKSPIIAPDKFLNIYIGKFGSSVPSHTPWNNPANDAIFLDYTWVGLGYRMLTHEAGHWLGLQHVFGGSGGWRGDNCQGDGDSISDTPPQRNATDVDCQKCPPHDDIPEQKCDSNPTNYNNYMDYSGCRKMFTHEQVIRMREVIRLHRKKLWP
jgi:hypothetical protein